MRVDIPSYCAQECDMFAIDDDLIQCRAARLAQILNSTDRVLPRTNGNYATGKDLDTLEDSMANCALEQQTYKETGEIKSIIVDGCIKVSSWNAPAENAVTRLAESIKVRRRTSTI
jgi:hypothetical protein